MMVLQTALKAAAVADPEVAVRSMPASAPQVTRLQS